MAKVMKSTSSGNSGEYETFAFRPEKNLRRIYFSLYSYSTFPPLNMQNMLNIFSVVIFCLLQA